MMSCGEGRVCAKAVVAIKHTTANRLKRVALVCGSGYQRMSMPPDPVCTSTDGPPPFTVPRTVWRSRLPFIVTGRSECTPPELERAYRFIFAPCGMCRVTSPDPVRIVHGACGEPLTRTLPLPLEPSRMLWMTSALISADPALTGADPVPAS